MVRPASALRSMSPEKPQHKPELGMADLEALRLSPLPSRPAGAASMSRSTLALAASKDSGDVMLKSGALGGSGAAGAEASAGGEAAFEGRFSGGSPWEPEGASGIQPAGHAQHEPWQPRGSRPGMVVYLEHGLLDGKDHGLVLVLSRAALVLGPDGLPPPKQLVMGLRRKRYGRD